MNRSANSAQRADAGVWRTFRATAGVALVALAMLAATVSGAAAHAVLLASEPADGSVLTASPREVVLDFNESVTPVSMRVIGPDGAPVAAPGTIRAIDRQLRLTLPPGLADGSYIVSWHVVSADSHTIGGAVAFAVGSASAAVPPPADARSSDASAWEIAKILLRVVQNVALMVAAGGALCRSLVLRGSNPVPGLTPVVVGSAAIAAVAAVLCIGVQGCLMTMAPLAGLASPQTWRLGAATSLGTMAFVMVPSLAVVVLASAVRAREIGRSLGALGGLVAAASLALTGHSAAAGWPVQAATALHVIVAAYWLGALWPLHVVVHGRTPGEALVVVRRFSAIAVPAVAVLVLSGIGMALSRIASPAALVDSPYGRLLLVKLALVAALLTLAAANRQRLTPALAGGSPVAQEALARNVRRELAIAGALLLVTGVLAHTPPPVAMDSPRDSTGVSGENAATATAGLVVSAESRGHTLRLEVTPAQAGANTLTLALADDNGEALAPAELSVALSLPAAGIAPLIRVPERIGPGRYALSHVHLPVAGRWHVHVDARIGDFDKVVFGVELPIR